MKKIICAVCFGLYAIALNAAPISFTNSSYQTAALALAGDVTNSNSESSPPGDLPLLSRADATADGGSASAEGRANVGFLGASADVSSSLNNASALGSSEFTGEFLGSAGKVRLFADFFADGRADGDGSLDNQLAIRLISNGVTLLDEVLTVTGLFDRTFDLSFGALNVLDILLLSSADVTNGNAQSNASANFSLTSNDVNETPVIALFALGLLLLVSLSRREPVSLIHER